MRMMFGNLVNALTAVVAVSAYAKKEPHTSSSTSSSPHTVSALSHTTSTAGATSTSVAASPDATSASNPIVDLGYSQYQGHAVGNGITEWLGIRYAAPPLGDLRFRAPQAPLVNDTLIIADTHGMVCHSSPSTAVSTSPTVSEDCLFLDVYAPTDNSTLHPVMVFFQGGGLNSLSNQNLNGSLLIEAGDLDIVFVTFNYRVGAWGFLASKEVQADGEANAGLLDQRMVLQWVQKNIALFGGDPDHVTIAGDSAGGGSVWLQLSAYGGRDDGLFHASAAESQSFGAQLTVAQSQYQYDALVARTGCNTTDDTLACLRALDVAVIGDNDPNIPTPGGAGGNPVFMWSNVVDGDFTTDFGYNLINAGKFVQLPAIWGDDTNEGTIFAPSDIDTQDDFDDFLTDNFVNLTTTQLSQIHIYYPEGAQYANYGAYWSAAALAYGEMRYNCPGIYLSRAYANLTIPNNYNYHWDVLSAANNASGLGVTHTAELASIFGTSSSPDNALIPTIQAYWSSFIRTKNPNTYKLDAAPTWGNWTTGSPERLHFVNTVADVAMEEVPEAQATRCAYFSEIGAGLQQ